MKFFGHCQHYPLYCFLFFSVVSLRAFPMEEEGSPNSSLDKKTATSQERRGSQISEDTTRSRGNLELQQEAAEKETAGIQDNEPEDKGFVTAQSTPVDHILNRSRSFLLKNNNGEDFSLDFLKNQSEESGKEVPITSPVSSRRQARLTMQRLLQSKGALIGVHQENTTLSLLIKKLEHAYQKSDAAIEMAGKLESSLSEADAAEKKRDFINLSDVWSGIGMQIHHLVERENELKKTNLEPMSSEESKLLMKEVAHFERNIHYLSQGANTMEQVLTLSWGSVLSNEKNSIEEKEYKKNIAILQGLAPKHDRDDESISSFFARVADSAYSTMTALEDFSQDDSLFAKMELLTNRCSQISKDSEAMDTAAKTGQSEVAFYYQQAINYRIESIELIMTMPTGSVDDANLVEDYSEKLNIVADDNERIAQLKDEPEISLSDTAELAELFKKMRDNEENMVAAQLKLKEKSLAVSSLTDEITSAL